MCVADITSPGPAPHGQSNANVMWEIGYAMALGKVPILISANTVDPPFDVRHMQHIRYDRADRAGTLEAPLARSLAATAREVMAAPRLNGATHAEEMLRTIVQSLIVRSPVPAMPRTATSGAGAPRPRPGNLDPAQLVGAWKNLETESSVYVADVGGRVVAPYCYGGNDRLSGVYFDWAPVDGWFFARYVWTTAPIRGFSFLRPEGPDDMRGAWWYQDEADEDPERRPDPRSGWQSHWRRRPGAATPAWASDFLESVRRRGLERVIEESTRPS